MADSGKALNLRELESLAEGRLSNSAWDYYRSGAEDEICLRANEDGYKQYALHYRVLRDVRECKLETKVLGQPLALPVITAPTAFQKMADPEGELATARATSKAGSITVLSSLSTTAVEDVVAAATGPVWFQLYVYRDRQLTRDLVQRVEAAGCSALVLTVDTPRLGRREADIRNRFSLPEGLVIENIHADGARSLPQCSDNSGLASYVASLLDPGLSWPDLEWLRSITKLPILVKGIVHPEDARLGCAHGVDGIIVSNHGGRQLDAAPATISVLADIRAATETKVELLIDGGIRRGSDIVKALLLGAKAVMIGRPILWGLACEGEAGVRRVYELLADELRLTLALCGAVSLSDLDPSMLKAR